MTVHDAIAGLSIDEKASLTSGADAWHTKPIERAGIPSIMVSDGPHGLRKQPTEGDAVGLGHSVPATCFPPAVGLASSWNPELARAVGIAIGNEARAEGIAVVLGPGVNIKRSPLCGRNFEYFSEDPFLTGALASAYVEGVQSRGVGTSLKHFAVNNQETDRFRVSAEVDERTLREIYLPAFERVVTEQQPLTVMCSYNKVNGTYASEHHWLQTELLRDEWGFDGLVVSDWGAVNDRVRAVAAGVDLTMPGGRHDDGVVADAAQGGTLDEALLDASVDRLLTLIDRAQPALAEGGTVDHDAHHDLAHDVALECAVLLKNDGEVLPLRADGTDTIAVIGEFARTPRFQGAGSSQVNPTRVDNALDAITDIVGSERVRFAAGFSFDDEEEGLVDEAVRVAGEADVVVCFLGLPAPAESEGFDRTDIDIPSNQLALLDAVAAANSNVVVALSNGSVVSVAGWQGKARAVLEGWLLGQASGRALADLLFGRANPSGKLTETIPVRLQDHPTLLHFPGADGQVVYGETIYVGYRYFDTLDVPVAHPFGYGMSYTTFAYADLAVAPRDDNHATVSFTITNTGDRPGAEIAQVYVRDLEASVDRPAHELKGFAKVHLAPGESKEVRVELDDRAFAYWMRSEHRWRVEAGDFEIQVGASSRDIRLTTTVSSPGDGFAPTLTAMSNVSEWVSHPVGGPLLAEAFPFLAKSRRPAGAPMTPLRRMMLGTPLARVVSMIPGVDAKVVEDLVAAAQRTA